MGMSMHDWLRLAGMPMTIRVPFGQTNDSAAVAMAVAGMCACIGLLMKPGLWPLRTSLPPYSLP